MSSQADRIKAFKLAQHTRIQKQEEEEQWISSEELCTEGSSDEETPVSTKTTQRKPKRNVRTEKRGISPLAQPPKVMESTSTYSSDSKYLSPDVYSTSDVVQRETIGDDFESRMLDTEKFNLSNYEDCYSGATCSSSQEDAVDFDAEKEIEKMIQWRPKRGSIKLPDLEEAVRASTLNHDIFANKAFYTEMALNMKSIKRNLNRKITTKKLENIDTASEENISLSQHEESKDVPTVNDLLRSISNLDVEISQTDIQFEGAKLERQEVERELCSSSTADLEISQTHSKIFQDYVQLCNFQNVAENKDELDAAVVADKCNNEDGNKNKARVNKDNKFVKRNIELAKQHNIMNPISLTDEEKLKLEDLLSDLDSEDYGESISQNTDMDSNKKVKSLNELKVNYFKLKEEEESVMKGLDTKLNEILKSYESLENGEQRLMYSLNEIEFATESAEGGKFWKHHQIELKLQKIDKELTDISLKDSEDEKKLKNLQSNQKKVELEEKE